MAVKSRSNRYFIVTSADNGDVVELGPAGTGGTVSTFVVQFKPTNDFAGTFAVLGKAFGTAAQEHDAPYEALPYRRVNVGAVASDYAIVSDIIASTGIIQVPANGLCVGLLTACTGGSCEIFVWDLNGPSAI